MPVPGDQHLNAGGKPITNPFEEVKPRISEYTALEIATLQSRLEKQLGPEYISSRVGPSGQKVHYLAAEKCIQLANEVFGFNGWSSQIMNTQVDFVDENSQNLKVSLGLSVIVRVTLRDGTYHEDVGYGHIENCKGKAAAFEKSKKEATTDALKRALRNFGNLLGNCIYDKDYLSKVTKIKAQPAKWNVDNLHRHSTCVPIKKDPEPVIKTSDAANGAGAVNTFQDSFDDEYGDFDEADFSVADPDCNPDEVILPEQPATSHHLNSLQNGSRPPTGPPLNQTKPPINRQPVTVGQGRSATETQSLNVNNDLPPQPQTPSGGFMRSSSGAGQNMRQQQDSGPQPRLGQPHPNIVAGRVLNQPSRNIPPSRSVSPVRLAKPTEENDNSLPPQGAGFFSARAAAMITDCSNSEPTVAPVTSNLPAFNIHAESPSIRKTPGVDHKSSKPLTKDLKHVPSSSQAAAINGPSPRPNIVNPQLDGIRRIGAPGMTSPMGSRGAGSYKPPTMKRSIDSAGGNGAGPRPPMADLPPNGILLGLDGPDMKKQKMGS